MFYIKTMNNRIRIRNSARNLIWIRIRIRIFFWIRYSPTIYMAIQHVQHDSPNQNNMYIELFGITINSSFFMFTVNI